jgi:WS/DGAT/MGAT family acyltransferase
MIEAGLRNAATQYAKLAQMWPKAAEVMSDLAGAATRLSDRSQQQNLRPAPKTLFNVAITNQRSFATLRIPLGEMKALAKSHDATLNDIVMALCAGGLRKFLQVRNALPEEPLQAGIPASLREPGDKSMNNQVTMVRVSLATDIDDPQKRLEAIRSSSQESKEMLGRVKGIISTDLPMLGSPWIMSGFAMLYGRSNLADRVPAFSNVAISNVPGPPKTLYVAGAKLVSYYPVSIPYHGIALNITVQSYAGSMDFGLTACRRAMPQSELYALVKDMKAAYAELEGLPPSELGAPAGAAMRAAAEGAAPARPH